MSLLGFILRKVTESNARGKSYADFVRTLESTGETVHGRFLASADTPAHRETAVHISGIEAWAASRLRVPLGAPLQREEYDRYRPSTALDLPALAASFRQTRAATIEIARALEAAGVPLSRTVPHNDMGDITLGAWLSYLISHAGRESRRL
jgi:hypothetical protein